MTTRNLTYKFLEAFLNLDNVLQENTGEEKPLVKIGVTPKVYDIIVMELMKQNTYHSPSSLNKMMIYGIELCPVKPNDF